MNLWLEFDLVNNKYFEVSKEMCCLMVGLDSDDIGKLISQIQTIVGIDLSGINYWESPFHEELQPIERLFPILNLLRQRLENKDICDDVKYEYISKDFLQFGLRNEVMRIIDRLKFVQKLGAEKVKFTLAL
ncbi:MAG TPA: hypothetical protein PKY82_09465 [Pyrinomonadaceae bacterium]|nr:hypothetical protein [Pyrinomonadaceae bacterium]